MHALTSTLEPPPRYTSIVGERFRIEPGLHPFPTDFGQGAADRRIFQIDATYGQYLHDKHAARQRRPREFYLEQDLEPGAQAALCQLIVNQLSIEHPNYFTLRKQGERQSLHNALRQEHLTFRMSACGLHWQPAAGRTEHYHSGLDALAMQLQEDLVVLSREGDRHWISAIHLCFPNHWSAPAKIGRPFRELHEPVPHFERIGAMAPRLVDAMVERGPYVRFAWGVSFDKHLDHDPDRYPQQRFDPADPHLFLRVERQCIFGIPSLDCALFTIRTYYYEVNASTPEPDLPRRLHAAITSMSDETLTYKGIANDRNAILSWLEGLAASLPAG